MPLKHIPRPDRTEYPESFRPYVERVPDGHILAVLESQPAEHAPLLAGLSEAQAEHAYADGKWSIKQILGHIADTERVFTNRALTFARGDTTPQPGFDHEQWAERGAFHDRPLAALVEDVARVRQATIRLFRTFDDEALMRSGIANELSFTVRSVPFLLAGHELHHMAVIRERYLSA